MESASVATVRSARIPVVASCVAGLAVLGAGLIIAGFWPGSIGWDYPATLYEASRHFTRGGQPPSAMVATFLLSLGTANPALIFVIKVLVYFAALAVFALKSRAPSLVKVLAAVFIFSPDFMYLAPLLRNNTLEAVFLAAAVVLGLVKPSRWSAVLSLSCLGVALLFSQSVLPTHLALIALYFSWRHPEWGLLRVLKRTAVISAVLLVPYFAMSAALAARSSLDRTSTIYVSALNGIGGLHRAGEPTCLGDHVARGVPTIREVLDRRFHYPDITEAIWENPVGFQSPAVMTRAQREAVISCWVSMAKHDPWGFAKERSSLAFKTLSAAGLDEQFVVTFDQKWGEKLTLHFKPVPPPGVVAPAIIAYGAFGERIGLCNFVPYAVVFVIVSMVMLRLRANRWQLVVFQIAAIGGLMLPQLLLSQAMLFRYYVTAATLAGWFSLANLWVILAALQRAETPPGDGDA